MLGKFVRLIGFIVVVASMPQDVALLAGPIILAGGVVVVASLFA